MSPVYQDVLVSALRTRMKEHNWHYEHSDGMSKTFCDGSKERQTILGILIILDHDTQESLVNEYCPESEREGFRHLLARLKSIKERL